MNRTKWTSIAASVAVLLIAVNPAQAASPQVGDTAADFNLKTPTGDPVQLANLLKEGPVVLVVLRGWPGYQCPICTTQVGELIGKSQDLQDAKAKVVLVYPGPSTGLNDHAQEFAKGKSLPANFSFVTDPDYVFTKKYDLRWDAPKETAYPSTFVIDPQGKVVFAKISPSHGGRAKTADVIASLKTIK